MLRLYGFMREPLSNFQHSPHLDAVIANHRVEPRTLDVVDDLVEQAARIICIRRNADDPNRRVLPRIQRVHLSDGHVERLTHALNQRLDDMSLVFERVASWDFKFECADTNNHV